MVRLQDYWQLRTTIENEQRDLTIAGSLGTATGIALFFIGRAGAFNTTTDTQITLILLGMVLFLGGLGVLVCRISLWWALRSFDKRMRQTETKEARL